MKQAPLHTLKKMQEVLFMLRTVSVETGLDDIKAHLNSCGYQVVDMAECMYPVEAVVYARQAFEEGKKSEKNAGCTVLINAMGLSGEQVVQTIEEKLG
jgi:hypothetical protein